MMSWIFQFFYLRFITSVSSLTKERAFEQLNNAKSVLNIAYIVEEFQLQPIFSLSEAMDALRFDCPVLFEKGLKTMNDSIWPPPKEIPSHLWNQFSLLNLIPVLPSYYAGGAVSGSYYWSNEDIESLRMKENSNCGTYNTPICDWTIRSYLPAVQGKRGLIVGSINPWAEAMLLNYQAAELITVEYTPIETNYPGLTVITPTQLYNLFLSGEWQPVDFIFTFSSLEHDGLGRYGDPINPWGDLEMMARLHCLLKEGGWLFFGVPTGRDALVWNSHRVYGRHRLRLLFQDWWEVTDFIRGDPDNEHPMSLLTMEEEEPPPERIFRYEESLWVLKKRTIL